MNINGKRKLPIGLSDFREMRKEDFHYIDKTRFIRDIIKDSSKVILFPRPRRFGKTLNLSMLRYFFEQSDENRKPLFDDLEVSDSPFFETCQGKYPVIWLTFKDMKALNWEDLLSHLKNLVRDEFQRHLTLLNSDLLEEHEKQYFNSILYKKADIADYTDSLKYLSRWLYQYYNQNVIILIDEYDTPIHAGYYNGYYKEIITFMRNFLSSGLKDNTYLFKAVLTGILRVAKESVFSGLNNLGVYTIMDHEFATAFGFTENEVKNLLAYHNLSDRFNEVADWYNGYIFGKETIYNPWSVLNFADRKAGKPRPYWVNTASTEIIDRLATREGRELREEIGVLLEGKSIEKPIYDAIVLKDLEKRDDLLWSFLLFSGYLKATEETGDEIYKLEIPNYEVRKIYQEMVRTWFAEKVGSNYIEEMIRALEMKDTVLFELMLQKVVTEVMSYHDLSGEPEKVYHALVLGMLIWMANKYEIRSNRESGYGRYDLMLKPREIGKHGIIIEFKKVKNDSHEHTLDIALKQIEDKKYAAELQAAGVKEILKIAVAFKGKKLWVKALNC